MHRALPSVFGNRYPGAQQLEGGSILTRRQQSRRLAYHGEQLYEPHVASMLLAAISCRVNLS